MISTINLLCIACKKSFDKLKSEYDRQIKSGKNRFFCCTRCAATFSSIGKLDKNVEIYLENPKLCPQCLSRIPYSKKYNLYCSRKCSALYTQKDKPYRIWSEKQKKKVSEKLKYYYILHPKKKKEKSLRLRYCKECKGILNIKKRRICDKCYLTYYKYYRPLCEFNFNLSDYPNKFDFNLIKKYGFYSPSNKKNNLGGISRDHLYCVKDGFINKIDPNIIKHPANCQLVIHSENNKKGDHSSITLDELKEKIENWSDEPKKEVGA